MDEQQAKCGSISPLIMDPSADGHDNQTNGPNMDDQDNLGNSDEEDDQAQMPIDDVQTECNHSLTRARLRPYCLHF